MSDWGLPIWLSYHLLPLHAPVLVPRLHLELCESERLGQVQPEGEKNDISFNGFEALFITPQYSLLVIDHVLHFNFGAFSSIQITVSLICLSKIEKTEFLSVFCALDVLQRYKFKAVTK